jgi:hypothetical protein
MGLSHVGRIMTPNSEWCQAYLNILSYFVLIVTYAYEKGKSQASAQLKNPAHMSEQGSDEACRPGIVPGDL